MLRLRPHISFALLAVLCSYFGSCSAPAPESEQIVARVGDRAITSEHLERSFHLQPKWGAGMSRKQAYVNQLSYLIDQKLFALAAMQEGLHEQSPLAGYLNFIEEKELIKALYAKEIAARVAISDAEYQRAYAQSKKQVKFNYIYTDTPERARHYFGQMKSATFDSIRLQDTAVERKGTTGMMSFGDLAPEIEDVIFDLAPGETAEPIEILNGYMVMQLVDGVVDKFMSEMDLAQHRSKLKKVISERKAAPLANDYVKKLMLEKNLILNPEVFFGLSRLFSGVARTVAPEPSLVPANLTDQELKAVDGEAASLRPGILATYEGGYLTVGEFLNRLQNMPAGLRPRVKMERRLKDAIGVMVRNRFLAQQAREAGLLDSPEVRKEIRRQQDRALAEHYLSLKQNQLRISAAEIRAFEQSQKFEAVKQRLSARLTKEEIGSVILDFKMAKTKLELADSLRQHYHVLVDSTRFRSLVQNPDEIIDRNPMPFVTRELFN